MPFNVEQHANLGYIDRLVKEQLDRLCEVHKRTLKAELEYLIAQAYDEMITEAAITNK